MMHSITITYHVSARTMEVTSPSAGKAIAGTYGDNNATELHFIFDAPVSGYCAFCAFGAKRLIGTDATYQEYEIVMSDATHGSVTIPASVFSSCVNGRMPVQLHMRSTSTDAEYFSFNQIPLSVLPSVPDPTAYAVPDDPSPTTFVPSSRKINEHSLENDVTITKGDVGLGNVENRALSVTVTPGDTNYITSGAVYGAVNDVQTSLGTEVTRAVNKENELNLLIGANREAIVGEANDRASGDNALSVRIGDEASRAQAAEAALAGDIFSEASSRQSEDTALSGRIDAEASARQAADNTLSGLIDGKQNTLTAGAGIEINGSVISADTAFHAQVFTSLPTASLEYKNTVALVLKSGTTQYYQYMCTTEDQGETWSWKQIGTTDIDLSGYYTKTEADGLLDTKQDSLNDTQMNAVNSGITSTRVGTYDGYQAQINAKANDSDLKAVAKSGSYNDLSDKPTIPTIPSLTKTDSGSGNAVTSISVSGHNITVTKGATFLTSHQTLPKYNGTVMTSSTNIPEVKTAAWDAKANIDDGSTANNKVWSAYKLNSIIGNIESIIDSIRGV